MDDIPEQLQQVANRLKNSETPIVSSPREILAWFGKYRRTWRTVQAIRKALNKLSLDTLPDFEGLGIDEFTLVYAPKASATPEATTATTTTSSTTTTPPPTLPSVVPPEAVARTSESAVDPVHRVSRFLSNRGVVSVTRDAPLDAAITQMLLNDFSQLPVMQGDRTVDGMISWHSIGKRQAFGGESRVVADCIEPSNEVKTEASILEATRAIREHECVLVRSKDNRIIGILTAADMNVNFEQVSEPFLLLSYVENHLRMLIKPCFTVEELQAGKDPLDAERTISDVADMTFGEYVRLLDNHERWSKLKLSLDRKIVVDQLKQVRDIRNDVMHFSPEGIEEADMALLRRVSDFLEFAVRTQQAQRNSAKRDKP